MNSKSFRRNQSAKHGSSSFISLHFNKADEDQLEISYKDEKKSVDFMSKSVSAAPQSNLTLYIPNIKNDALESSQISNNEICGGKDESVSVNDSLIDNTSNRIKKSIDVTLEEPESKFSKGLENKNDKLNVIDFIFNKEDKVESGTFAASDANNSDVSQIKLSPAIEAAEINDSDSFNQFIIDELDKTKCEILHLEKEKQPSSIPVSLSEKDLDDVNASCRPRVVSETAETVQTGNVPKIIFASFIEGPDHFSYLKNFIKFAKNNVKFHFLIIVLACLCAPIPSWISGFVVGMILSGSLVYLLYKPQDKKKFQNFNFVLPQSVEVTQFPGESSILKGWMNELPSFLSYNSEKYHVSCTRSVYVRLDGSYLRLSFPQKNISKRAMFNEPRHEMQFVHQQHYDIADAVVELLPKGLSSRRLWLKKYPICLRISNSKEAVLSTPPRIDNEEGSSSAKTNKKENSSKKFLPRINENNEVVIYLFSRTDRDKNLWYNRFIKASKAKVGRPHSPILSTRVSESDSLENKRTMSVDFAFLQSGLSLHNDQYFYQGNDETDDSFVEINISKQQKFELYMSTLLAPLRPEHPFGISYVKKEKKDAADKRTEKGSLNQNNLTWLNVLIGRLFFDFLIEDMWAQLVKERIQKKLNKLKLPFFLTELIVKDINLGSTLPKIHHASDPTIDEKGLWIDIDVSYNGSFHMTLETKLNLSRLKVDPEELLSPVEVEKQNEAVEQIIRPSLDNSDEDSVESSSDEEIVLPNVNEDISFKEGTRKKFMKFVDKVAQSPYFQHAKKNKYIKKAMDDLSNTPLVLTVEVQWLTGTLAINIPPCPTDRLWYGFRTNPSLSITARPKLGQHVVTFTQVTEWIEKKLVSEFQKVLVMPNMDDLIIPIMQSSPDVPLFCSKLLSL